MMFQINRRNQDSYWYLPDEFDDECHKNDEWGADADPCAHQWGYSAGDFRSSVSSSSSKSCLPVIDRVIKAARERASKATRTKLEDALSMEAAKRLQEDYYTSWPSTIWDTNLNDSDGEIVFDCNDDDDDEKDDDADCGNDAAVSDGIKSVGTLETEDETIPSPMGSYDYQNTWERDDLDLSVIPMEHDYSGFDSPLRAWSPIASAREEPPPPPRRRSDQPVVGYSEDFITSASNYPCGGAFRDEQSWGDRDAHARVPSVHIPAEESKSFGDNESYGQQPRRQQSKLKQRTRSVRFADEEGKQMETIHLVENTDYYHDPTQARVLILLLLPKDKKFEFVHAEYSIDSRLPITSLLRQLPHMAKSSQIKQQRYSGLCKAAGGSELINALAIQDYTLTSDEILVAVPKGYSGRDMYETAKGLVANEKILRAVKRTHRREHVLHRFKSDSRAVAEDAFVQSGCARNANTAPVKPMENEISTTTSRLSRTDDRPQQQSSNSGAKVEIEVSVEFRKKIEQSMRRFSHPLALESTFNLEEREESMRRTAEGSSRRFVYQHGALQEQEEAEEKKCEEAPIRQSFLPPHTAIFPASKRVPLVDLHHGPAVVLDPAKKILQQGKKLFHRSSSAKTTDATTGKLTWASRFAKKLKIGGKRHEKFCG